MTTVQPNVTGRKSNRPDTTSPVFSGEVLWTKRDLATFLNVSVSGLEKMIARKAAAPHIKVGGRLRWVPEKIREFYSPDVAA